MTVVLFHEEYYIIIKISALEVGLTFGGNLMRRASASRDSQFVFWT